MAADVSRTVQVIERCKGARFTGILRIHAAQGQGELWFVSGIPNGVRFGVTVDDEAMDRILAAEDPKVELVPSLPSVGGGPKKGHPLEGALGPLRAVDLFRFCESQSLTCTLEIAAGEHSGTAAYELGELLSVSCDQGTDSAVAEMLGWASGRYRFVLPAVELPEGVHVWAPAARSILPEALAPETKETPSDEADARTKEHEAKIRRRAEELAGEHKAELAAAKQRSIDADAKKRADDAAAKKRADDAAAAKRDDDAAAKKRDDDAAAAKKRDDDAAAKKRDDDAAAKKRDDDAAAAAKKRDDDAAAKKRDDAAAKKRDDDAAAKKRDDAAAKKRDDDAAAKKRDDEAAAKKRDDDAAAKKRDDDAAAKKRDDEATAKKRANDAEAEERAAEEQEAASAKPEPEAEPHAAARDPEEVADRPRRNTKSAEARAARRRGEGELAAADARQIEGARDRRPEMYLLILLGVTVIAGYLLHAGRC